MCWNNVQHVYSSCTGILQSEVAYALAQACPTMSCILLAYNYECIPTLTLTSSWVWKADLPDFVFVLTSLCRYILWISTTDYLFDEGRDHSYVHLLLHPRGSSNALRAEFQGPIHTFRGSLTKRRGVNFLVTGEC